MYIYMTFKKIVLFEPTFGTEKYIVI